MMVAVEVDEMSQMSSQLFKGLILGPYNIWWPYKDIQTPFWHHITVTFMWVYPQILILARNKVQWWWQLRWMKCLHCHPNSSKAWYRVHTTFDDPTKIYRHCSGITLQQHSCEYTPRDPADFCTTQSAMMVAVEVDEMSQMSSQLFKGLI